MLINLNNALQNDILNLFANMSYSYQINWLHRKSSNIVPSCCSGLVLPVQAKSTLIEKFLRFYKQANISRNIASKQDDKIRKHCCKMKRFSDKNI